MGKALKLGGTSASGSVYLFAGKAISSIALAVGTLILGNILLPEEYGLYYIALLPSQMITLFEDWGTGSAMTKFIASSKDSNTDDLRSIILAGVTFKFTVGTLLSIVSLLVSNFVATVIFHRPESSQLIGIASLVILSNALFTAAQQVFIGFERMKLNVLTMICQAVIKTAVSPLLVILGYGAIGAIIGHTLSFFVAGVLGVMILFLVLFKNLKNTVTDKTSIIENLKRLLHYGVPLSVGTILAGFLAQFFGFMMAYFISDQMIGNYQIATNFGLILTFLTYPILTVLFPAFAKLDSKKEKQLLSDVFKASVKYTSLFLVPLTIAIIVLAEPMVKTLFGLKWLYAPYFLALYSLDNLSCCIGDLSLQSFLVGIGETRTKMKLNLLTVICGLPLACLLIPVWGIPGAIIGLLLSSKPRLVLGMYWVRKHYSVTVDWINSVKIVISSALAGLVTYFVLNYLQTFEFLKLGLGAVVFLTVYIVIAPAIGAIKQEDISNFRVMFSDVAFVSKLVNFALDIVEKVSHFVFALKNNKN